MPDIPISKFQASCCSLIHQIGKTGQTLRITRRGHPVAEITTCLPIRGQFVLGDMVGTAEIVGDIVSPVIDIDDISDWFPQC
jgi:hypothetical protein